jgi:hypothetical protein
MGELDTASISEMLLVVMAGEVSLHPFCYKFEFKNAPSTQTIKK